MTCKPISYVIERRDDAVPVVPVEPLKERGSIWVHAHLRSYSILCDISRLGQENVECLYYSERSGHKSLPLYTDFINEARGALLKRNSSSIFTLKARVRSVLMSKLLAFLKKEDL